MEYNVQQLCMEVIITYCHPSSLCRIQAETIINIYVCEKLSKTSSSELRVCTISGS
jgi:hypothetical protein